MAVQGSYSIRPKFREDFNYGDLFESAPSLVSPGQVQSIDLANGNNTITVPSNSVAVMIIPPTANTETLTLKGVNGDTGIALHLTNPFIVSLSSVSSFVISAGNAITGVRFIFV